MLDVIFLIFVLRILYYYNRFLFYFSLFCIIFFLLYIFFKNMIISQNEMKSFLKEEKNQKLLQELAEKEKEGLINEKDCFKIILKKYYEEKKNKK